MKKENPNYIPITVGDLVEILKDYPQDSPVRVTQYYGLRSVLTQVLWRIPFLDGWARKHNLDTFSSRPVEMVSGNGTGSSVEIG